MADLERILTAYERGLLQLHDDLSAGLGLDAPGQDHLDLLNRLFHNVLRGYLTFYLDRAAVLDTTTSVMYAVTPEAEGRVLDVPLRSLVDHATLSSWQARYLNGSLNMKRSLLVAGAKGVGKSTLLSSLIGLISLDQRMVSIEEVERLPALKNRSFTMRLAAKAGTPARATALKKGLDMQPTWLLLDGLLEADAATFLGGLHTGLSGLATFDSPHPEATLNEWAAAEPAVLVGLRRAAPLIVLVARDESGRSQVLDIFDVEVGQTELQLQPRRPQE
jgi:Flp pilus assembly CpaF family ATPase